MPQEPGSPSGLFRSGCHSANPAGEEAQPSNTMTTAVNIMRRSQLVAPHRPPVKGSGISSHLAAATSTAGIRHCQLTSANAAHSDDQADLCRYQHITNVSVYRPTQTGGNRQAIQEHQNPGEHDPTEPAQATNTGRCTNSICPWRRPSTDTAKLAVRETMALVQIAVGSTRRPSPARARRR